MGSGTSRPPPTYVDTIEGQDAAAKDEKEKWKWKVYSEYLDFVSTTLQINSSRKAEKPEELNVGRQVYSDVMLTSSTVSGVHGKFVFDKERQIWQYTDTGSSTGSILMIGGTNKTIKTNELVPLGVSCALRLGRAIVTVGTNRLRPEIRIRCIAGEHKDESWELKSYRKCLSFGTDQKNVVRFISSEGISSKHLRIFKFNGSWALLALDHNIGTTINGFKARTNELIFLWIGAIIKLGGSGKDKFVVEGAFT